MLKSRVHARGENIVVGDYIYYHKSNNKSWQGPDKVIGINGKKLFIDKGTHMATVNRDNSVKVGEEFWSADQIESENGAEEEHKNTENHKEKELSYDVIQQVEHEVNAEKTTSEVEKVGEEDARDRGEGEDRQKEVVETEVSGQKEVYEIDGRNEEIVTSSEQDAVANRESEFHYNQIRKGDLLRFIPEDSDQEVNGQVVLRAGKVGGRNEHWWNITNRDSGVTNYFDSSKFRSLQKIDKPEDEVQEVFVVQDTEVSSQRPKMCRSKRERT